VADAAEDEAAEMQATGVANHDHVHALLTGDQRDLLGHAAGRRRADRATRAQPEALKLIHRAVDELGHIPEGLSIPDQSARELPLAHGEDQ
jgi:hypothetical protein